MPIDQLLHRRSRALRVVVLFALVGVAGLTLGGRLAASGATTTTTIGFDNLADEATITTQYASEGITFRGPGEIVQTCEAPLATSLDGSHSPPVAAETESCPEATGLGASFSVPVVSLGLYARVDAGEFTHEQLNLDAVDAGDHVIGTEDVVVDSNGWTLLSVAAPANETITGFDVVANSPSDATQFLVDDVSFSVPTAPPPTTVTATAPGPSTPTTTTPGPAPTSAPPTAVFATVPSSVVHAPDAVWLGAKDSSPGGHGAIVAYDWDLNGDGKTDEVCGASTPATTAQYPDGGTHHVLLTVVTSDGSKATSEQTVTSGPAAHDAHISLANIAACMTQSTEQPSTADCVKSFQFNLIDVNARGSSCFTLTPEFTSPHAAHARAAPVTKPLTSLLGYHATVTGPVSVDGLPIPLPSGLRSEYDSQTGELGLGHRHIDVGPFTLADLDLDLTEPEAGPHGVHNLAGVDLSGLPSIGGLHIGGGVTVDFVYPHETRVTVNVVLPDVFSMGSGQSAGGQVAFEGDNQAAFKLQNAHLHIDQVFLGPLLMSDFDLDYQSEHDAWNGTADLTIPGAGLTLHAKPPPADNGVGFKNGGFDHAGATLEFSPADAPDLFPGVQLTEIGFAMGLHPTRFLGSIQIKVVQLVEVDGQVLVVLASPEEPYVVPDEGFGGALRKIVGRKLTSTSVAVGGAAGIDVPAFGEIPLANAYVLYEYPSYFEFYGGIAIDLKVLSIKGGIGGFVDIDHGLFNIEGQVGACVAGLICTNVDGVISSKGIAACGSMSFAVFSIDVGAGYYWGHGFHLMFEDCDVGPYRVKAVSARARAADAPQTFDVAGAPPTEMLEIQGHGDAPRVTITGPDGRRYPMGGQDRGGDPKRFVFLREPALDTTYIALVHPAAGRWSVTADQGSVGLGAISTADGLRPPSVHAAVTGEGATRTLHYDWAAQPGEQVSFVEQGPDAHAAIGSAHAGRGALTFHPAFGRAATRSIVAMVSHDGLLTEQLTVARFHVSAPRRPARPRRVRLVRHGTTITVRWNAAAGAARYAVTIVSSDGGRRLIVTSRRHLAVSGVRTIFSGTVFVAGLRIDNVAGPAVRARFAKVRVHRKRPRRRK